MSKTWLIIPFFGSCTYFLYFLSKQAPSRSEDGDEIALTFPSDLESLQAVARALQLYSARNWNYVFVLFASAYTYKQAFCIPGSGVLNILAGALYGLPGGLIFVCVFTALGASLANIISKHFYADTVKRWFPDKFSAIEKKVQENRHRLFYFMIFIRVVPVSPGWAINLVSPFLKVPLPMFFITTFIGLIPYNFLGVSAGGMITSLTSVHDIFTWKTFLFMLGMATAALIPTFFVENKTNKESKIKI